MSDRIKKLVVTTPQGEAGVLHHDSRYAFNYTTAERACEASLTMPLRPASYASGALPIAFAMNLPEGAQLIRLQERFKKAGVLNDMKMLAVVGGSQIGRLIYHDPAVPPRGPFAPQIGLREILTTASRQSLFEFLIDTYLEAGISGVQPKVMVPDGDTLRPVNSKTTAIHPELIVKAAGDDFPFLTQNEYLCMEAARVAGIDVPKFWLSEDRGLFVMKRFDVRDGQQHGFEDMSVMMGKQPDKQGNYKYESSYESVAKVLTYVCGPDALRNKQKLFEYVALSVMVRNGDAHLKNFGVLYDRPGGAIAPHLAPLYDVVTTTVYGYENARTGVTQTDRTLALRLNKEKRYPSRDALLAFGTIFCHVSKPHEVIERIATAMSQTLENEKHRVDESFMKKMAEEWDNGRMTVEPTRIFQSGTRSDGPACVSSGEYADILAKAAKQLGTIEAAESWLAEPAMGLDQRRPIDLLSTPAGVQLVEEFLTRLEYGIYGSVAVRPR